MIGYIPITANDFIDYVNNKIIDFLEAWPIQPMI